MAQILVKDANDDSVSVARIADTGQQLQSGSLPVTLASDDDIQAKLGVIAETAPVTDTGASGINGRLQRVAQRITTLISTISATNPQLPTNLGSQLGTASLGVTASTDDVARTGVIAETAPASDTASSGLNGRLQRIAQRIAQLIALVPVSLGIKAAADSFCVTHSTEDVARIGATNEAAAASDNATSGLNGLLKRICGGLTTINTSLGTANTQLPLTTAGNVLYVLTRPANATPYTAGDSVGGALTIPTGLTAGQHCVLLGCTMQQLISAVPAGMTSFTLWLYDATPVSAFADNAAFNAAVADADNFLGAVTLTAVSNAGQTNISINPALNFPFKLGATANVYAYLTTTVGYTPAGNSEVYNLRLTFLGL